MSAIPRVISMYSFKGGAGRTVCTANVAAALAQRLGATSKQPMLVLDMDLDSAGLTVLLEEYQRFEKSHYSCSRLVGGEVDLGDMDQYRGCFDEGMVDVSKRLGAAEGSIRFLGTEIVGRQESVYVTEQAAAFMQDFLAYCAQKDIVGVLIDSASGRQETALLCHRLAQVVVYCCRLTQQFVYGTKAHLERFVKACGEEGRDIPSIALLPVAVPEATETWKPVYDSRMTELLTLARSIANTTPTRFIASGITEVESFKWMEAVLHTKPNKTNDECRALDAYAEVVRSIGDLLFPSAQAGGDV